MNKEKMVHHLKIPGFVPTNMTGNPPKISSKFSSPKYFRFYPPTNAAGSSSQRLVQIYPPQSQLMWPTGRDLKYFLLVSQRQVQKVPAVAKNTRLSCFFVLSRLQLWSPARHPWRHNTASLLRHMAWKSGHTREHRSGAALTRR